MSLFDNDINLPGVVTEIISDYASGYDTSLFGTTDSVMVLGTAFNGPVGKAVEVYSPEHAKYIFGSVYNSKTRKETTLVANIQDAWDRGCRTIYACRISGKDIFKDYQLAVDTNLKLRVAGLFPSNDNKDLSLLFDKNSDEMSINIYKPAERATINEKKLGVVESSDSIIVNTIDLYSTGITVESELTELIKSVNNYTYNNVIRMAIVDEDGNDVTQSSIEAKSLRVGDMFPGLYTIGRSANAAGIIADTKTSIVLDEVPYDGFEGIFYKKLSLNTNVAQDLPLYSENADLNVILGISTINEYDFLKTSGMIDAYFLKNSIDYEEVDIADFDLYKRLGKGYAINAQVVVEEKTLSDGSKKQKVKVKEVTDKDKKKAEIADGIYSTLENVPVKYRVLTKAYADKEIKGSLPKASEFKFAKANSIKLLNDAVTVQANVESDDLKEVRNYEVSFEEMTNAEVDELATVKANLYNKKTAREATLLKFADIDATKVYEEGSLFLVPDATGDFAGTAAMLYSYTNGKLVSMHAFDVLGATELLKGSIIYAGGKVYVCNTYINSTSNPLLGSTTFAEITMTDIDNKGYLIASLCNGSFVIVKVTEDTTATPSVITATTLGSVDQVISGEEDVMLTTVTKTYNTNVIKIRSNQFDFLTIDEVVGELVADKDFEKLVTIATINIVKAEECIADINKDESGVLIPSVVKGNFVDKVIAYDTTKKIPFRTDDNFARHLAQHCTYTSLKTSPTHGMIGVKTLLNTSIDSITKRVNDLVALNLSDGLVAKRPNGANMLDKNNMPYPIGRKISVIVGQYNLTTDSNYVVVSNMAAGYAGMVSDLDIAQSSTCQTIDIPAVGLSYEFTNYQLGLLNTAGFVTVKKSFTKGWVITDGITMAPADTVYRRLSASRITDEVEDLIRTACEPFIGKQNHLSNQNSLKSAIKSALETIKSTLIESYDFNLVIDSSTTQLGIITVNYSIVPIYEIKEIKNNITVKQVA
jgi:hypothetical protein